MMKIFMHEKTHHVVKNVRTGNRVHCDSQLDGCRNRQRRMNDDKMGQDKERIHRVWIPKNPKKNKRTYQTKCMYIQSKYLDRQIVEIAPEAG